MDTRNYWLAKGRSDASRNSPFADPMWASDEARSAYREGYMAEKREPRVIKRVMDDGFSTKDGCA